MKRVLVSLLALAMIFAAGCQKTPEEAIVTGKSSDDLIEKARADAGTGALAEKLGAPETYQNSVSSQDGKLTVTIDAAVTVPEAEAVPIIRVSPAEITQAQADTLMEKLPRSTLYSTDRQPTKDEIEAELDENNVERCAGYLHKLTKNTQFIIITHRRGTMAAADRLYGITMQEKGVSALVSVNLIEDDLDA